MKKNQLALGLIFCLFFLWAISSNLLPTMIRQLMKTCELNTFEASFTAIGWASSRVCSSQPAADCCSSLQPR